MIIVIDNCLPISWVSFLQQYGHTTHHWRELGKPNAADSEILGWATSNNALILTQDLDFTKLLFQLQTNMPSIIQLRIDDIRPANIGEDVLNVLTQHAEELGRGALITIKGHKARLRLLPIKD